MDLDARRKRGNLLYVHEELVYDVLGRFGRLRLLKLNLNLPQFG